MQDIDNQSESNEMLAKFLRPQFHIATSGWCYSHWKHVFYPDMRKPADYLQYYARHFTATEINTTFYSLPPIRSIEKWRSVTSASFLFSPKMYRGITHDSRLEPVLIQLPPSLACYDRWVCSTGLSSAA